MGKVFVAVSVEVFSACSVKEDVSIVHIPLINDFSSAVPGLCFVDECDVHSDDFVRGEYDFCGACEGEGVRHGFHTI